MTDQHTHDPADRPTDLDVVDDVGGTDADRAFDAEVASLLRSSTASAGGTASVCDIAALKERGLRRRRRSRAVRTAALAAAAAVVVVSGGVVLHDRTTTPQLPATGTSLPLLPDAPTLPLEDEQRLRDLPEFSGLLPRGENTGYLDGPITQWATPVDCAESALWAGMPVPVLPSLDASGFTQVCVTDSPAALASGTFAVSADGSRPGLYRFYLPRDLELDQVTPRTAAAMGVSWTGATPVTAEEVAAARDTPDPGGRVTTVPRPGGGSAVVSRTLHESTDVTRYEWLDDGPVAVSAVLATDPVTAVRATLEPHPCDVTFNLTPVGTSGGAATAGQALEAWLDGGDDFPSEVVPQDGPRSDWVVVEEREEQRTYASGDWRATVYELQPGSWMVTGGGCATPYEVPPAS